MTSQDIFGDMKQTLGQSASARMAASLLLWPAWLSPRQSLGSRCY